MLFRRFMWITLSVAIMGVVLAIIIQATYPTDRQFRVENRSNDWSIHKSGQSCEANMKYCSLFSALTERA